MFNQDSEASAEHLSEDEPRVCVHGVNMACDVKLLRVHDLDIYIFYSVCILIFFTVLLSFLSH